MRHYLKPGALGAVAILLAAGAAWGDPTFSYTTDFESDADGATPAGWVVSNSGDTPLWVGPSNDPKVMAADPALWATQSVLGAAGVVNYAVPWSGSKRFTIHHPGWDYNAAFASGATFTGAGATYSGTYPMNLQTNGLKAEFDVAMRTGRTSTSTHGFVFTVQPVEDAQHVRIVGEAYGREGYDHNGFGVEVDVYNNTGGGGAGMGDPDNSHVGVNLYRLWDINGSFSGLGITAPSLKTNVEQGVANPFPNAMGSTAQSKWLSVGNNNQPLHFTVYYNDPAHGGLGVVRVYLKVRAADKAAGDPAVPAGQTPFSFGEGPTDPPDGILMVEACVGAFPTAGAAFGFVAARSGSTHISQVDNVHVETNAVASGTPCTVTYPSFSWGTPVFDPVGKTPDATLTQTPVQTDLAGMTQRGWDVASYVMSEYAPDETFPTRLDVFKGSIRAQYDGGYVMGSAVGEPSLNYLTAGGYGNVGDKRLPPGMASGRTWAGILAKGWIYFPVGNTDYDLCMNSDNGYEVRIGNQIISFNHTDGIFQSGLNGGSHFNLHVNTAGVYPIQVLWFDYGGGAYCEFYRRTDHPMMPYLLVGDTTWGVADQPLVFGLRNGAAAPDYISEYTALPPFTPTILGNEVTLTAEPVTGTLGSPGWNVMTYPLFQGGSDVDMHSFFKQSIAYCDANGLASPVVTGEPSIAYASESAVGNLPDRLAPGLTAGKWNEHFGLLCNGYIMFPGVQADYPRTYSLAVSSDDGAEVRIGGQVVIAKFDATAGTGIDAGGVNGIIRLTVNKPGIYPIQVLYKEGCCGDGIEFYRRNFAGFPTPYIAVGSSQGGFPDQPLIYGTLNGQIPAKDLDGATPYTGSSIVNATLSPTERAGAVTDVSGDQLFNIKTVWAPHRWYAGFHWWCYGGCVDGVSTYQVSATDARPRNWFAEDVTARDIFYGWGSNGRTSATGWLDTLQNRAGTGGEPRSTTQEITCNRSSYSQWGAWYQPLGDWEALPNYPPTDFDTLGNTWNEGWLVAENRYPWQGGAEGGNFAVRWDGYAVLEAKDYWIGCVTGWDNITLSIGNQVLQTTQYPAENPGRLVRLHVTEAGAYPIRIETQHANSWGFDSGNWDQIWNDAAGAILFEVTPGHARVPLNSATSSIKVYQSCTPTGPFGRQGVAKTLPAERKVAQAGQGGTLGWNGTVAKNGVEQRPYMAAMVGALIKDNMYSANPGGGGGAVSGARDTGIVPGALNLWDKWESPAGTNDWVAEGYPQYMNGVQLYPDSYTTMTYWQDWFTAGTAIKPDVQNSPLVASFTGYIEFPTAGDYALNICSQDGAVMWIGGEVVNYRFWTDRGGGLLDSSPSFIHVDSGGIWDVRVDYFTEAYNSVLQVYQYNPDGTRAYINDAGSTIKVYSSLAPGVNPATTQYVDPTELDPTTAAPMLAGSQRGLRVQVVQATYDDPEHVYDPWWGSAHGPLYTREHAKELLATVLDGTPSINQKGVKVYDGVVDTLVYAGNGATALNNWPAQPLVPFPGLLSPNAFAVRVTGYLAIKKGGHIFSFLNDDGVVVELGGRQWHSGDATGWAWQSAAYFYAPVDGLYPIKIEYNQIDGGYALHLLEMHSLGMYIWDHAPGDGWEVVNDGDTATKAYAALCPVPWADTDGDQDVDQADFGVFQACFTGTEGTAPLPVACTCLDRGGEVGTITVEDLNAFLSCWSGPEVPSTGCP